MMLQLGRIGYRRWRHRARFRVGARYRARRVDRGAPVRVGAAGRRHSTASPSTARPRSRRRSAQNPRQRSAAASAARAHGAQNGLLVADGKMLLTETAPPRQQTMGHRRCAADGETHGKRFAARATGHGCARRAPPIRRRGRRVANGEPARDGARADRTNGERAQSYAAPREAAMARRAGRCWTTPALRAAWSPAPACTTRLARGWPRRALRRRGGVRRLAQDSRRRSSDGESTASTTTSSSLTCRATRRRRSDGAARAVRGRGQIVGVAPEPTVEFGDENEAAPMRAPAWQRAARRPRAPHVSCGARRRSSPRHGRGARPRGGARRPRRDACGSDGLARARSARQRGGMGQSMAQRHGQAPRVADAGGETPPHRVHPLVRDARAQSHGDQALLPADCVRRRTTAPRQTAHHRGALHLRRRRRGEAARRSCTRGSRCERIALHTPCRLQGFVFPCRRMRLHFAAIVPACRLAPAAEQSVGGHDRVAAVGEGGGGGGSAAGEEASRLSRDLRRGKATARERPDEIGVAGARAPRPRCV